MIYKLILCLLITVCCLDIQAQVRKATIIDELETPAQGKGIIRISGDPKIKELIGVPSSGISASDNNLVKTSGFRIQVFMSSARTARRELDGKVKLIGDNFPEIATYPDWVAPNWKLLAGDFMTREEAEVFRQKLQKTIPQLGKEMYIVQDRINIPIKTTNY
jgi:hypothetical protein